MNEWIAKLFEDPQLIRMGHGQSTPDLNLGLGWVYYGLARALRPATVVVIGSYRGFVPLVFAKALTDNANGGRVIFIDPSLVDDFWKDADEVKAYFQRHGVSNIQHYCMTTQQFVTCDFYRELQNVGILFVDGYHSAEQARFDHEAFADQMTPDGMALFHDSVRIRTSHIYGRDRPYQHTVKNYMDELRSNALYQVLDLPCFDGVTFVRQDGAGS